MITREWPMVKGDDEYFRLVFPPGVDPNDYVVELLVSPGVTGQSVAAPTVEGQCIVWRLPRSFTSALVGVQRYACRVVKDSDADDSVSLDEDQSTIAAGRINLRAVS